MVNATLLSRFDRLSTTVGIERRYKSELEPLIFEGQYTLKYCKIWHLFNEKHFLNNFSSIKKR